MNSPRGNILVIRGGAIGDFILTLPALQALRDQFPLAHLEVLGYPHIVQLAQAGGLVDRIQSIEARALAGFFARHGGLDADLSDYFSEFDIIVSYLFDPDSIFQTNVKLVSTAQFIVCPHRPDDNQNIHAAKVYLKPLERLAIFNADPCPHLSIRPQSKAEGATPKDRPDASQCVPTIALHPGSGSKTKTWAENRWAGLLQQLLDSTRFHFLLVGGEAEGERLNRLVAGLPRMSDAGAPISSSPPVALASKAPAQGPMPSGREPPFPDATCFRLGQGDKTDHGSAAQSVVTLSGRIRVAQSLALSKLAALLETCDAFIGHDSGISHLAAALGLPGLVLWGDTLEEIWRPPQPKVVVLKKSGGLDALNVDDVMQELRLGGFFGLEH